MSNAILGMPFFTVRHSSGSSPKAAASASCVYFDGINLVGYGV